MGPPRNASSANPLTKPPRCVGKWRPLHGGSRPLPLGWNPPVYLPQGGVDLHGSISLFSLLSSFGGLSPAGTAHGLSQKSSISLHSPEKRKISLTCTISLLSCLSLALFHCCLAFDLFFFSVVAHVIDMTSLLGSAFSSPLPVLIGHLDLLISALSPRE